jgi:microcystin-dependent protein
MSEPYIGEIRMFGGNWAPRNWAMCDGQLVNIQDNESLYTLLGTYYGGDGTTTFALPDMRCRLPIHMGHGIGLTSRLIGTRTGTELEVVTVEKMPTHDHQFCGTSQAADSRPLSGKVLGKVPDTDKFYAPAATDKQVNLIEGIIQSVGGNQPHWNLMPYTCVSFIISLDGHYPPRN